MFVKDYMTRHPIIIGPHMRIFEAQELMTENSIRHLPVAGDGKRLLGLLTRQRLRVSPEDLGSLEVWEITRYLSNLTVDKVMVKGGDLHTIGANATLEEAADVMIRHKIGGLPVLDDDEVIVGVITETDLLFELRELLGATDPGWRIVVRIPSRIGEYARLTNAISGRGWAIMAMGSVRTPKDSAHWDMVLKVTGCEKSDLVDAINEIEEHELIDIRQTVRNVKT
ncbi:MAG: CBS and ACT domain-containing protein [Anaerolineae bacterium]